MNLQLLSGSKSRRLQKQFSDGQRMVELLQKICSSAMKYIMNLPEQKACCMGDA
ncbi:MAG: hypothetical protein LCH34_09855 [Firmicutes bacterium]|nr:hypothetical protein [Bacillota bacterium]